MTVAACQIVCRALLIKGLHANRAREALEGV